MVKTVLRNSLMVAIAVAITFIATFATTAEAQARTTATVGASGPAYAEMGYCKTPKVSLKDGLTDREISVTIRPKFGNAGKLKKLVLRGKGFGRVLQETYATVSFNGNIRTKVLNKEHPRRTIRVRPRLEIEIYELINIRVKFMRWGPLGDPSRATTCLIPAP